MNDHETEDLFKPRESERISRKDTVHVKAIVAILGMLFLIAIGYLVLLDPILDFFDKARGVSRKEPVGEDNEGMIPLGEIQSIPLPHARAEAVIPEKIYEKNPVVPSPAPVTPKKTEPEKKTVKTEPEPAVKEQMETEPAMMKDFQKKMNILRETYENNLRQTKEQHLEKDIALRETYTSGLLMLMDKLQRNGNLDYWVSIRDELNRFKKEGTIPEDDSVETLPEIKHIRREYQQVLAKQAAINSSEIILLCENYIHHLKSLQTQLTMDDRIGDALEVRAVIKKMEEGPELQSARFELAVYETNLKKAREQMTVTPDKETKGTETAAKTENPPESENIHKQAKETTKPSGRAENDKKYSERTTSYLNRKQTRSLC